MLSALPPDGSTKPQYRTLCIGARCHYFDAERTSRVLEFAHLQHGRGIANINHNCQPAKSGNNLTQEFDPLAGCIDFLDRQAGDVAARPRQARDEAVSNRIACIREHDRGD